MTIVCLYPPSTAVRCLCLSGLEMSRRVFIHRHPLYGCSFSIAATWLLNAFLSLVPGNSAYNLRRLWLSSANSADLSLVFAPAGGELHNSFLDAEYLATL